VTPSDPPGRSPKRPEQRRAQPGLTVLPRASLAVGVLPPGAWIFQSRSLAIRVNATSSAPNFSP